MSLSYEMVSALVEEAYRQGVVDAYREGVKAIIYNKDDYDDLWDKSDTLKVLLGYVHNKYKKETT